jgi:hypothetical protein
VKVTLMTNSANGPTRHPYDLSVPGAAREVLAALARRTDDLYVGVRLTADTSRSVPAETISEWATADTTGGTS